MIMEFNSNTALTVNIKTYVSIASAGRNDELDSIYECRNCGFTSFKCGKLKNKPYLKCEECGEIYWIYAESVISND